MKVLYVLSALLFAADALTAHRARLPVRAARVATTSETTMRYGKKQVKIRQKINRMLLEANDIEGVAAVLQHPYLECSNRRMMKHLVLKARRKAIGWTRKELAARAGLDPRVVQLVELDQWSEFEALGRLDAVMKRKEAGEEDPWLKPPEKDAE